MRSLTRAHARNEFIDGTRNHHRWGAGFPDRAKLGEGRTESHTVGWYHMDANRGRVRMPGPVGLPLTSSYCVLPLPRAFGTVRGSRIRSGYSTTKLLRAHLIVCGV